MNATDRQVAELHRLQQHWLGDLEAFKQGKVRLTPAKELKSNLHYDAMEKLIEYFSTPEIMMNLRRDILAGK